MTKNNIIEISPSQKEDLIKECYAQYELGKIMLDSKEVVTLKEYLSLKETHTSTDEKLTEQEFNKYIEEIDISTLKQKTRWNELLSPPAFEEINKMIEEEKKQEGFDIGFKIQDVDIKYPNHSLSLVGGYSGAGKTTFMMNNALKIAEGPKEDKKIIFLNLEQTKGQLLSRFISCSGLKIKDFYNKFIKSQKIIILDSEDIQPNIQNISDFIETRGKSFDIMFIDYIQLISDNNKFSSAQLKFKEIARQLLELSKKYKVAIVTGSQLNKEEKESKEITLDSIRESQDIAFFSSLVLMISDKHSGNDKQQRAIYIAKTRGVGKKGDSTIFRFLDSGKIEDKEDEEDEEVNS